VRELASDIPLALYIHLPWCESKCPYCDFNSHPLRGVLQADRYIAALLTDLDSTARFRAGRSFSSVFFGGGTPSLFSAANIGCLLDRLEREHLLGNSPEITLEANPGSAEASRFRAYRDCGVNRLSIGVQSFDDGALKALGRVHDSAQARAACASASAAGFDNFNIDLMHGLPGQDEGGALADLDTAIEAEPTHLSLYQLTIEPHTAFAADPPQLPTEETAWDIRCTIEQRAATAGFDHYEVSAFSLPDKRCRHNLNYWQFGDYVGLGAGAHSKITQAGTVYRWARPRHPRDYLNRADSGLEIDNAVPVSLDDVTFEFLLNALRLKGGFSPELFEQRTGLAWQQLLPAITKAKTDGLLEKSDDWVCTTVLGWRFLDDLLQRFLVTGKSS
jgi:putative oxygen-independent coproporphyrinogen III oxidase